MAVVDADRRLVIPTGMRRLVYALGDAGPFLAPTLDDAGTRLAWFAELDELGQVPPNAACEDPGGGETDAMFRWNGKTPADVEEHQVRIGAFDGRGADPALALSSPARQVGSAGPPGRRASSQCRAHRHGTPPARVADMRGEVVANQAATTSFGVDDMARQHRAVRSEVSELRGMIDSCRATQRTDGYRRMLAVLVARLRERLVLHFESERESADVARLVVVRPETAEDIARFAADHEALLTAASRLAELLRTPNAPPDVVAKTMQWLDDLRQHEEAEDLFLATT